MSNHNYIPELQLLFLTMLLLIFSLSGRMGNPLAQISGVDNYVGQSENLSARQN